MTKKLAIMGSGNGSNFEAIAKFLQGKDVEITCLSDVKDAFILKRAQNLGISHEFLSFEKNYEYFSKNKFDLVALAGYMKILDEKTLKKMGNVINIHPSILPSFRGKGAIKKAFLAGVKLSGVTIHWVEKEVDKGKIIAQYPVFIENAMSLDEFEQAIHNVEHKLYPIVIEKLLEDKVFDFQELITPTSNKKCGGCGGCQN